MYQQGPRGGNGAGNRERDVTKDSFPGRTRAAEAEPETANEM